MKNIFVGLLTVLFLCALSSLGFADGIFGPEQVCGVDVNKFPQKGEDPWKTTCIVKNPKNPFDPWVDGLAFIWVNATGDRVFQVLTDYRSWPKKICNVQRTRFIKNDPLTKTVEWKVSSTLGSIMYTNEYHLSPITEPKVVDFEYVGPGDLDDMVGQWAIFSFDDLSSPVLLRYIIKLNPKSAFLDLTKDYMDQNIQCLLSGIKTWAEEEAVVFE
ncbi:MAG TPA: hypothetical protein VJL87_05710 [Bdellovibrionota bacterium]|nr:hypothetical protein [Bdellovibrionota bacterium]